MIASVYSLQKRLELFVSNDLDPFEKRHYRIERIVSYDNGETWIDNWVRNDIGTFSSSAAASITGDSLDAFLVARGMDNKIWWARLSEYYEFKNTGFSPIGIGIFSGEPAVCSYGNSTSSWPVTIDNPIQTSYNGVKLMVFGKGTDERIWWAFSNNGGGYWDLAWSPVGAGTFTSSPAAACSADGKLLTVFARGKDNKIWWAFSTSAGAKWDMAWSAIGEGKFTSRPAAACSADGKRIYVFAKGKDNKIWWAFATNGVQKWDMAWQPIGDGVFTSSPSANCSWDGKIIHVFARGNDNRIWQARSHDYGANWDIAWRKVNTKQFANLNITL